MENEILIALIAAISSVVVSILTAIFTYINSRKNFGYQKLLDKQKTELLTKIEKTKIEQQNNIISRKKKDEKIKEMFLEKSKSTRNCIKGIQDIKDSLTLIIYSYDKSLSYAEFIGNAKDTSLNLTKIYKQEMNNLDEEISEIVHASKRRAQDYNELVSMISEEDYNQGVSAELKEKLFTEKNYFSRKQEILREKLNIMRDEFYAI